MTKTIFENFVITGEADVAWQNAGAQIINSRIEKAKAELHPAQIPLATSNWIDLTRDHLEKKFSKLGVDEVNWPKYVVVTNDDAEHGNSRGHVEPGIILINTKEHPTSKSLEQFLTFRAIVQEMYHASAPEFYNFESRNNERGNIKFYRRGFTYDSDHEGQPALEEGLATLEVAEVTGLLEEKCPTGFKEFLNVDDSTLSALVEYDPNIAVSVFSGEINDEGNLEIGMGSINSTYMTLYIREVIGDNFYKLIEESRLLGNDEGLISAIEKQFGRGAYEDIRLATEDTAPEVVSRLRSKYQTLHNQ